MRALFFVEPLVLHSRPFHYWSLLGHFADMAHGLRGAGWDVRVVVNEGLAVRATAPRGVGSTLAQRGHGLPDGEVVVLRQEPIRRLFGLPNSDILAGLHHGRHPGAAVAAYGDLVRAALDGFVPDVMLAFAPAAQLRAAFPDALLLACETAAYSRAPFARSIFLDPEGLWGQSVPATRAAELLAREPSAGERALLEAFRARFGSYFRATSPFAPLEEELRALYGRVGLLPLQFAGEPGFDCNAPFRNQGEYLLHALENLPADVGLAVVEHPTAHWLGDIIDAETRAFLGARWPNLRFIDFRQAQSAGQVLLAHVDFCVSISSSIGLQALLLGKPLVSVGWSHLATLATVRGLEGFPAELPPFDPRVDRVLAWMMTRYFPPLELVQRGSWLSGRFASQLARWRAGRRGLDLFEPIASDDELAGILFAALDAQSARLLTGRLANGDFALASGGPGPYWLGGEGPDGWHLLDLGGGVADARLVDGPAVSVRRYRAGTGPTLYLARVPDAASCAGSLARLRFRARSDAGAVLGAYLYLQIDDGQPCMGTEAQSFALGPEWRQYAHVAFVPSLGERTPGPKSHVEVVFALPPDQGAASFELAEVVLEPVAF